MKKPGNVFIIAEVAQAHEGSLSLAHAYIDAIAAAGADAVKFQTHLAAEESTARETFRVAPTFAQDASRYDYWRRMEFSFEQWQGLVHHSRKQGLEFLSTPFSLKAVDLLVRVGVKIWKIGSGEITNRPLIDGIAALRRPVILSTGMSSWKEIDQAVKWIKSQTKDLTLLQCASVYPSPPKSVGLNVMAELKKRYRCPVGLSDHSGTIFPSLAAVVQGASVIEVHVTLSRQMPGFDVTSSVTIDELQQLVKGVRFMEEMLKHPVNKDQAALALKGMKKLFHKSIVACQDLPLGTVLQKNHLAYKKPGDGLSPECLSAVLGRTLRRNLKKDELILKKDLK